ncbi:MULTISPECIES: 6-phosphogluconate dehydrogenase [Croceitalea]|uniref:6-phosphogluconate dehydrogenase n=1 Tax=Croceitalea vernalis TaxID=3075599 RepID=A0ABU3BI83_9FLAO|nr:MULTISPECIES: 6-phosphogluconate dehydrogenase [unclassified Croceitalea]MDT0540058.1 6-phosphogluconate dehydrogenase [Croceitalea sp. P059]MDT0621877.1 6-phosphogluconate dehydrogenase [Croceitalea sp. P007]
MRKFLFILITVVILAIAAYFAFVYYVPFSEGYRSGELIKFSRKGVLAKTWEGEISQGISGAQIFEFSVEDSKVEVIQNLKDLQGKYVKVTYKERYSTFFWLGDTKYFIIEVEPEKSPHFGSQD